METDAKANRGGFTKQGSHLPGLVRFLLILPILLSSCASSAIQTVEVTRVVHETVIVNQLLEVIITTTPIPAASTINPNLTPEACACIPTTPPFIVWNTQQVVNAFTAAGLEVENTRPMTADDYGLVPMLAVEGTRFFIPSVCADCGGRILSFTSEKDLTIVRDYYAQMGKFGAVLFSWVFIRDNILVQINGELPEATARLYEQALMKMK